MRPGVVAGSAVFNTEDYGAAMRSIREAAMKAIGE